MKELKRISIHVGLFLITFVTTTLAGAYWVNSKVPIYVTQSGALGINPEFSWFDFVGGMWYSIPFLIILTAHEFGHYFTASYYKIKASLPYFIPLPIPAPIMPTIGTLGAVIRIKSKVYSNLQHFDIGLAGPLAGFIITVAFMFYGFLTLPETEYIFEIHPEYKQYGVNYPEHVYSKEFYKSQEIYANEEVAIELYFGTNLLFKFFEHFIADPSRVPDAHEMMHYPILMACFLALFFTSLNLLPIGQLDGGHVIYGLFGKKGHRIIAITFFILLLLYSGLGFINVYEDFDNLIWLVPCGIAFYYVCLSGLQLSQQETLLYAVTMAAIVLLVSYLFPHVEGYSGWLVFGFLIGRFLGVYHPPSEIEKPLDNKRIVLGWICLIIFIISFSPEPLILKEIKLN